MLSAVITLMLLAFGFQANHYNQRRLPRTVIFFEGGVELSVYWPAVGDSSTLAFSLNIKEPGRYEISFSTPAVIGREKNTSALLPTQSFFVGKNVPLIKEITMPNPGTERIRIIVIQSKGADSYYNCRITHQWFTIGKQKPIAIRSQPSDTPDFSPSLTEPPRSLLRAMGRPNKR